jgi:DNA polymerase
MTFELWRDRARAFLLAGVRPYEAQWGAAVDLPASTSATSARVPRRFLDMASAVACHRDPQRWTLLYSVLYRLTHGIPHLLEIPCDGEVNQLVAMEREVGRDVQRMQSFVRFRVLRIDAQEHYIAWHRPDHYILERTAPWFAARFRELRWSILTPDDSAHWDGHELRFGRGISRSSAPADDELESLWRGCCASVFQLSGGAVRKSALEYIPAGATLDVLHEAIHACRACDLACSATQPVFGEGPAQAAAMFVGEQPGENEDRTGRPFVGPAGQLFDRAMAEAGLDRRHVYLTGAVKHFKFTERGKRRIHKTADRAEISACRPWLQAQIDIIRPRLLVALGATAAFSLTGRQCAITEQRGRWLPHESGAELLLTLHPSFVLRLPDRDRQAAEYANLVTDLKRVREKLLELPRARGAESHRQAPYAARFAG